MPYQYMTKSFEIDDEGSDAAFNALAQNGWEVVQSGISLDEDGYPWFAFLMRRETPIPPPPAPEPFPETAKTDWSARALTALKVAEQREAQSEAAAQDKIRVLCAYALADVLEAPFIAADLVEVPPVQNSLKSFEMRQGTPNYAGIPGSYFRVDFDAAGEAWVYLVFGSDEYQITGLLSLGRVLRDLIGGTP